MKLKKKIKIAIDSPAAAGAGTQAKLISKHFNLFYLDTGKIYRLIANIKLTKPKRKSEINLGFENFKYDGYKNRFNKRFY